MSSVLIRPLLLCVACLLAWLPLVPAHAAAAVPPPAAAERAAFEPGPPKAGVPHRMQRPLALSFTTGWNGLGGQGLLGSYTLLPQLAADLGLGWSALGLRTGLRARWNLLSADLTPFVAAGVQFNSGVLARPEVRAAGDGQLSWGDPEPRRSLVGVPAVGLAYQHRDGFVFLLSLGYGFDLVQTDHLRERENNQALRNLGLFADWNAAVERSSGMNFTLSVGQAF